jgi:hypothetical protein
MRIETLGFIQLSHWFCCENQPASGQVSLASITCICKESSCDDETATGDVGSLNDFDVDVATRYVVCRSFSGHVPAGSTFLIAAEIDSARPHCIETAIELPHRQRFSLTDS